MINCKIDVVTFDESTQMGIIVLKSNENKQGKQSNQQVLPIWVGLFEAQAILFKLQGSFAPRPLTHDLLKNCIENLKGSIKHVLINDIEKNTFYAQIHVAQNNKTVVIDARPSDAIALAVRVDVPIYVNEKVFEISGVNRKEFFEQQKNKLYRTYLESLDSDTDKTKH